MVDGIEVNGTRETVKLFKANVERRKEELKRSEAALRGTQQLYQEALRAFLGIQKGSLLEGAGENILQRADEHGINPQSFAREIEARVHAARYPSSSSLKDRLKAPESTSTPDEAFQLAVDLIRREPRYKAFSPLVYACLERTVELSRQQQEPLEGTVMHEWIRDHHGLLWPPDRDPQ